MTQPQNVCVPRSHRRFLLSWPNILECVHWDVGSRHAYAPPIWDSNLSRTHQIPESGSFVGFLSSGSAEWPARPYSRATKARCVIALSGKYLLLQYSFLFFSLLPRGRMGEICAATVRTHTWRVIPRKTAFWKEIQVNTEESNLFRSSKAI